MPFYAVGTPRADTGIRTLPAQRCQLSLSIRLAVGLWWGLQSGHEEVPLSARAVQMVLSRHFREVLGGFKEEL